MEAIRSDDVGVVGIYGMGGIGKSTMAEEIQQKAKQEKIFDEVAVAVVSQKANVSEIQSKLAGCLNLIFLSEDDEWNRAARLKARFMGGKKILVVLDDVWERLDLIKIGLDFPTDHKGCKILLTSRNLDVCHANNCPEPFEIQGLNSDEAWMLFKHTVGDLVDHRIEQIAQPVCRECGGLPLVLQAVASALKRKDLNSWIDAQERFKNFTPQNIAGIDRKVFGLLKKSYDYLEDEEAKSCFLLCCLFPEDAIISIKELTFYAKPMGFLKDVETIEKARIRVITLVGVLKSASLLLPVVATHTALDATNYCRMHDVIRDVAISIASTDEKTKFLVRDRVSSWPEIDSLDSCKLISIRLLRRFNDEMLPNVLECPKLHTLELQYDVYPYDSYEPLALPKTFLQRLKTELRVLHLRDVSLPWSVLSELTNLRMLNMKLAKLGSSSKVGGSSPIKLGLEKLEMLRLLGLESFPLVEFGPLKQLRLLEVVTLSFLLPAGFLSSLSCLEELYIPLYYNWDKDYDDDDKAAGRRKSVSVVELSSLTHLTSSAAYFENWSLILAVDAKVFQKLNRYN